MEIEIRSASGAVLATVGLNVGAKGYFSLMRHDYVVLPFSLREPVVFGIGSWVDLRGVFDDSLGGKLSKVYYVTEAQSPTYNTSTGGYDYNLRLDAYYWLWNNRVFRYTPEADGGEASWSLTGTLDMHMGVFLRNLKALGFFYDGTEYTFSIDGTVADKPVAMTYDNTRLLDALFSMGSKENWDCDVWVADSVINFGRLENGSAVRLEVGKEAASMTRSESSGTYATRIYAFGSERNIPKDYRPVDGSLLVNGVVQKRLMLPEGVPYVDAAGGLSSSEVVEEVVVFDDIYPRRVGKLSNVRTVKRQYDNAGDDEAQEPDTYDAYQYRDTGLKFDKKYILEGRELRVTFQSGLLNGMDFGVVFEPGDPGDAGDGSGVWEIVANEDYGRLLPDDTLKPGDGDEYVLYGFDISLVSDQYVPEAEDELLERAREYAAKRNLDDGTYTVPLYSHWVKEDTMRRTFDAGQRILLVNPAIFPAEGRESRVIGWEMNLDIPYDTPTYTIGESPGYSRLGDIEGKVDTLAYKGARYSGGGGGVYVVRVNDSTPPSDSNVLSSLRALATLLRKDRADETKYLLGLLGGAVFGKDGYAQGLAGFGAKIDDGGHGELDSLTLRRFLEVPELRYNRTEVSVGDKWGSPGAGIVESVEIDTGDDGYPLGTGTVTLHLEEGEIGAVAVDDICMGIFHDWADPSNNSSDDYDDGMGNRRFAGFFTSYFRITEITESGSNRSFRYSLRPQSGNWPHGFHPCEAMHFVCYGNFTDTGRQSSNYSTRTYWRFLNGVSDWEFGAGNVAAQFGDLSNLSAFDINMEGYSAYLNNIYMSGTIEQFEAEPLRMEVDYGNDIFVSPGQSVTVKCAVFKGWKDVSGEVSVWNVSRDSGDQPSDSAWDSGGRAAGFDGSLTLSWNGTEDDFRFGGGSKNTLFSFTATMSDGTRVQGSAAMRPVPEDGTDGVNGKDGADGVDGADGADGKDAVRYWLVTDIDSYRHIRSDQPVVVRRYGQTGSASAEPTTHGGVRYRFTAPDGRHSEWRWADNALSEWTVTIDTQDAALELEYYDKHADTGSALLDTATVTAVYDGDDSVRYWFTLSKTQLKPGEEPWVTATCMRQSGADPATATNAGRLTTQSLSTSGTQGVETETEISADGTAQIHVPTYDTQRVDVRYYVSNKLIDIGTISVVRDGAAGEQGAKGLQGCILRTSEWAEGVEYHNDDELTGGTRYIDIAVVTKSVDEFDAYQCTATHVSNADTKPGSGPGWRSYWVQFNNMAPIYTPLIMARYALLRFSQTNQLLVMKEDGVTVAAGMGGGDYPLWVGAETPESAPFKVGITGNLISTDADITGRITATSGSIGGFEIASGRIGVSSSLSDEGDNSGGMSLNDGFIKFSDEASLRSAFLGENVLPAISGDTCLMRLYNATETSRGTNYCILATAANAAANIGFKGSGAAVVSNTYIADSGITEINPPVNSCTILGYSITNMFKVLARFTNDNSGVGLPSYQSVRTALGLGTNDPFAVRMLVVCDRASTKTGFVAGRTSEVTNMNTTNYPQIITETGNPWTTKWQMAAGDIREFLLAKSESGYYAYLLNLRE